MRFIYSVLHFTFYFDNLCLAFQNTIIFTYLQITHEVEKRNRDRWGEKTIYDYVEIFSLSVLLLLFFFHAQAYAISNFKQQQNSREKGKPKKVYSTVEICT